MKILFIAVHKIKETLTLNRPAYVRMCILDISKTLMYDFHYNYISKRNMAAIQNFCFRHGFINPYLPRLFSSLDYLRGGPRRTLSLHVQYS